MKKIFLMMAALACAGTALTGCDDNTDPKAQVPTEADKEFLNTPPTANFAYILNPGSADATETVTLTCSQPNYGVATIPTYAVQLSLDPDFAGTPTEWQYTGADATPLNFVELPNPGSSTTINIPARDVADAINACRGYNDLAQLSGAGYSDFAGKVYFRIRAYFANATADIADRYTIISNVVALNNVTAYATLRQPGYIYLVGAPEGWAGPTVGNAEHYNDWKLYEADDQIDSKIYSATFDIPAGKFQFRFYTALNDWDFNSVGSQDGDSPVDIAMKNGIYTGACVVGAGKGEGKGSWQIPDWAGGEVTITVNLKAKTVEFKKID